MTTEERMKYIEEECNKEGTAIALHGLWLLQRLKDTREVLRSLTEDSDKKWYDAVQKAERILEGQ